MPKPDRKFIKPPFFKPLILNEMNALHISLYNKFSNPPFSTPLKKINRPNDFFWPRLSTSIEQAMSFAYTTMSLNAIVYSGPTRVGYLTMKMP